MSKRDFKPSGSNPTNPSPLPFPKVIWVLLVVIQVVCPLLFFTNLTRNPYFTQISLLYITVALCGFFWALQAFHSGEVRIPSLGFEKPLLAFLSAAFISWFLSWLSHPLLRPGITFEGMRVWVFTLVNSVMAIYLPVLYLKPVSESKNRISIWTDIICALLWCGFWLPYSSMKNPDPSSVIDAYAFILWAAALLYALGRTKNGEAQSFFHLVFAVSIVAGLYGVSQYAGRDVIWASPVLPYGGRPVSSFGNPNFLSSYLLLACPLAVSFALAKEKWEAYGYYTVALISAVSILCTLTRSTYVGLLAAFFFLGIFTLKQENLKSIVKITGLAVFVIVLVLVFPGTPVSKIQSPLARFTEIFEAMKTGESYGPWHQRILIWSSAWDMVRERFLFGKGWGCFELFYPFYQGAYLFSNVFAQWRTHANNAHNILMEIWSQTGFIGMGLALLLFVTIVTGGFQIIKKKTQGTSRLVSAGLLAGWLGMVVDNFFGNVSIFFAMPAFLFWWYAGSLYSEAAGVKVLHKPANSIGKKGALAFVMIFCLFVVAYYGSRWAQEIYYFEGFKASKNNQLPESVRALEKAYLWFPGEVNSNYELGNSYARTAKVFSDQNVPEEARKYMTKAIGGYKAAIKANPGYDEIYFNLGVTQIQMGEKKEGVKNLRLAVLINPLLRGAYGVLSTQYAQEKNWTEARAVLEQGVRAFPRDKEYWNNLAYVDGQIGDDQKSFEASKKAVQLDPTFKTSWENFNAICAKIKVKDPLLGMPPLLIKLSQLLNEKKFSEAQKPASELVKLMPDNADVGLSYANILFYQGEVAASISEYERVIKLDPNFAPAQLNLGRVYLSQKDFKQARHHLQKAYDINPQDSEIKKLLASLP